MIYRKLPASPLPYPLSHSTTSNHFSGFHASSFSQLSVLPLELSQEKQHENGLDNCFIRILVICSGHIITDGKVKEHIVILLSLTIIHYPLRDLMCQMTYDMWIYHCFFPRFYIFLYIFPSPTAVLLEFSLTFLTASDSASL